MYTDFYGLIREPFGTTPDADNLFLSPSHREALGSILYGIKERKGVILVTGEVGVGKTTILRRYLQIAAPSQQSSPHPQQTVHLYNPNLTFERLLATILQQLGIQPAGAEQSEMLRQLHEAAGAEHGRGGTIVLVIDEAQCMPIETLEGIRMLTNLETAHDKLIQIVLTGQPELEALLERHEVRHVRERIAVRARILPLTESESLAYIQHRLDQASREQVSIFSPAALRVIVQAARGIPRRLNILCDNTLMAGFRRREPIISRQIAQEVTAEIDDVRRVPLWKRREAAVLVALLALVVPAGFYLEWFPTGHQEGLEPPASERPTRQQDRGLEQPAPASPALPLESLSPLATAHAELPWVKPPAPLPPPRPVPVLPELVRVSGAPPALPEKDAAQTSEASVVQVAVGAEMISSEDAESGETARLLVVLLDAGRVVLGKAQASINNPRLEDKGFSGAVFHVRLRKEFLARTGHDLQALNAAAMPERAKPLLSKLAGLMQKAVQEVQTDINKKGIGFKGFIPATFGTQVAAIFSRDTGLKLRQIGPPEIEPRNPENRPDEQETEALLTIQKSHPRVGDHVISQRLPDHSVRVLLPLFYTRACLSCHGKPKGEVDISGYEKEGFKEGDLGGAISVILPAAAETAMSQ
ncbi:AAA family ATPase [Nitrospira defluvii]|uniref:AAA domain-containing protein n=1 Tax=Nitrospira defluvii TaxID=330214 RepID=A0ABM8RIV9_9BACT|nr:AAA family ATPase [Nitrospira defluvii]CAE6755487.1 AAA domain-containing protein [Nitrospira defluvii]